MLCHTYFHFVQALQDPVNLVPGELQLLIPDQTQSIFNMMRQLCHIPDLHGGGRTFQSMHVSEQIVDLIPGGPCAVQIQKTVLDFLKQLLCLFIKCIP